MQTMPRLRHVAWVLALGTVLAVMAPLPGSTPGAERDAGAQGANVMTFVYFVEQGAAYNQAHADAIETQALALQRFWFDQFGGTFALTNPIVTVVNGDHTSSWYNLTPDGIHSDPRWYRLGNISSEVRNKLGSSNRRFVNYPTSTIAEPRVGANFGGAWMDGDDMRCILEEVPSYPYPDGNDAHCIGHVAHELGHVYGLPHSGEFDDCMQFGFYDAQRLCDFGPANRSSVKNNPANAGWLSARPAGGPAASMTISNQSCSEAELFWNNDGVLVSYGTVAAGETRVQGTYAGTSWRAVLPNDSQNHLVASTTSNFRIVSTQFCPPPTPIPTPTPIPVPFDNGDADCSEGVDIVDALLIAQYSVGNRGGVGSCDERLSGEIALAYADYDGSGAVDIVDALLIARCVAGICDS